MQVNRHFFLHALYFFAGFVLTFGAGIILLSMHLPQETSGQVAGTQTPLLKDTNYAIPSGAIFMSVSGSDSNNGTINAPVKTAQKASALAPQGGTIVLRGGLYRDGSTASINKKLTWQAYPHEQVWLDGTNIITGWQNAGNGMWFIDNWNTPTFCNGQYYSYPYNAQKADNTGPCNHIDMAKDPRNPMAGSPQMVFVDGVSMHEVTSQSQVPGNNFYYDKATKKLYLGVDPTGHTVELAARPTALVIQGGSGGGTIRGIGFKRFASNEYNGNATHGSVLVNEKNFTLENNVFWQNAGAGVSFANAQNAIVKGNLFFENGFNGLDANGHSVGSGTIDNMLIEDNIFDGNNTEFFGTGCSFSCSSAGSKMAHLVGFTLKNNIFQNNVGHGYWCDLYCTNATIVNNVFRNNTGAGLYYEVSFGGIIASNLMHNNGEYGFKGGSGNVKLYNNTIVDNKINLLMYDDSRQAFGSEIAPETTNVEMVNNILSGGTQVFQNWKGQTGAEQLYKELDYNSYYRPNGSPSRLIEWRATAGTVTYNTLASFTAATNWERNGQDLTTGADPFFVNGAGKDYRIRPDSLAYANGKPLPSDVAIVLGLPVGQSINSGAIAWVGKSTSPLPTISSTKLGVTVLLHGIGRGGDNTNPAALGTANPIRQTRTITAQIYDVNNQLVLTKTSVVTFDAATGTFKGVIDTGVPLSNYYTIKLHVDQYLRTVVPGIQKITAGTITTLPATTLPTGDMNLDNQINIIDYNILVNCFSDFLPAKNCSVANKALADITDDNHVNQFDYNLFLREVNNRVGDGN